MGPPLDRQLGVCVVKLHLPLLGVPSLMPLERRLTVVHFVPVLNCFGKASTVLGKVCDAVARAMWKTICFPLKFLKC